MAFYVDTSAAVKLVVDEPESGALHSWAVGQSGNLVSSDLTRTELLRATRLSAPERMGRAREVLETLVLLTVPTAVFELAGSLEPDLLRSLDAVHLAAALELGDDLEGVVAYDTRLTHAARANGIVVLAPGEGPPATD